MGCVLAEKDSLARFTALNNSPRNVMPGIPTAYKAYKICHSSVSKNATTVVVYKATERETLYAEKNLTKEKV